MSGDDGNRDQRRLLAACPDMKLAVPFGQIRWRNSILMRGVERLLVMPLGVNRRVW
ncbi:hypothetical protein IU500_00915 [Nocardia terpenica]|uniref:hypothetical protein n=1 Tax=Nocardia terpenica TaxID=455432 RepID=UPI0002FA2D4D|nr:hypothetical protein [Nocardia terpenica]MBF6059863.1 hypothetical protein [Nocardia terpenica]MBF6102596.1 hypothetical protein [Nocardia terpenica]MBF6111213.1 hypothetical protein [Nocardia terpenica]MBF6117344.1 hypothetical protein [Nocardia terpenica]MBF6150815.1 hypothetical protein [Nocardia terpenica]